MNPIPKICTPMKITLKIMAKLNSIMLLSIIKILTKVLKVIKTPNWVKAAIILFGFKPSKSSDIQCVTFIIEPLTNM